MGHKSQWLTTRVVAAGGDRHDGFSTVFQYRLVNWPICYFARKGADVWTPSECTWALQKVRCWSSSRIPQDRAPLNGASRKDMEVEWFSGLPLKKNNFYSWFTFARPQDEQHTFKNLSIGLSKMYHPFALNPIWRAPWMLRECDQCLYSQSIWMRTPALGAPEGSEFAARNYAQWIITSSPPISARHSLCCRNLLLGCYRRPFYPRPDISVLWFFILI